MNTDRQGNKQPSIPTILGTPYGSILAMIKLKAPIITIVLPVLAGISENSDVTVMSHKCALRISRTKGKARGTFNSKLKRRFH
jgi:hypothetical protein